MHRGRFLAALPGSPKAVVLAVDRVLAAHPGARGGARARRQAWPLSELLASDEARARLLDGVRALGSERVALGSAAGRVLA